MLFGSKKATLTAAGGVLVAPIVTLVAVLLGLWLPDSLGAAKADIIESVSTLLAAVLGLVLASYNIGQGIADRQPDVSIVPPQIAAPTAAATAEGMTQAADLLNNWSKEQSL